MIKIVIAFFLLYAAPCEGETLFSQLDSLNRVVQTIVIPDAVASNGAAYCKGLLPNSAGWQATSGPSHATPGYIYNSGTGTFLAGRPTSIIIYGDSIIDGFNISTSITYPYVIGPVRFWTNSGVTGNHTDQIAVRVATAGLTYTDIFIEGGVNDILGGYTVAATLANYKAMFDSINPLNKIHLIGINQVDDAALASLNPQYIAQGLTNAAVAARNAQINALCHTYTNCQVVAPSQAISTVGNTRDGLHPAFPMYTPYSQDWYNDL